MTLLLCLFYSLIIIADVATDHDRFDEMGFAEIDQDDDEIPAKVTKKMPNKTLKEKGLEYQLVWCEKPVTA